MLTFSTLAINVAAASHSSAWCSPLRVNELRIKIFSQGGVYISILVEKHSGQKYGFLWHGIKKNREHNKGP